MIEASAENPIAGMGLDFGGFLEARRRELGAHTSEGGIPDYAFGLDRIFRQRIDAVAPARYLVRILGAPAGLVQQYLHRTEMIAVGARQLPKIYSLGESCARRLGIRIPQIFITGGEDLAAYSFATDGVAPVVILSAGLVKAFDREPGQLMFVIGHECGHVHNLHGAYNTVVQNLTNPLAKAILDRVVGQGGAMDLVASVTYAGLLAGAISGALKRFFLKWSRAAELTCDRAGLVCCGNLETAQRALAAFATGGASSLPGINIEAYRQQLDLVESPPLAGLEPLGSHPLIAERIKALRSFAECDVLYTWRPDVERPSVLRGKHEVDSVCARIIGVLASEDATGRPATAG